MKFKIRDVAAEDAEKLAHILVTTNESTFRGRVPDQCLEFPEQESAQNWRRTLTEGLPDDDFLVIAEAEPGVATGYVWGGPYGDESYQGEIRQISVLPQFQGNGLGKRLVGYAAGRLAERGIHSLRVTVLEVNPNRTFYEYLGAQLLETFPYVWEDTAQLMPG